MNFDTNCYPQDTGRKLNVHKTFKRCLGRLGRLLNVLCTFNLRPVYKEHSNISKRQNIGYINYPY